MARSKSFDYKTLLNYYVIFSSAILVLADHKLAIYFAALLAAYSLSRFLDFRPFVIVFILIEEAAAYYIGGGLHGEARSLIHDYLRSVQIFLTHFYLRSKIKVEKIELLAGLHGAFREIILPKYFSPAAIILFGPVVFVYGYPLRKASGYKEFSWGLWLLILLMEIIVGIADVIIVENVIM